MGVRSLYPKEYFLVIGKWVKVRNMLNVRKISLLAFWSLELYTLQKSECQAPGASRATSSGLRNGLVPGSWRIYGHLNPVQMSRREAWERASQVHDKIRTTAGERGFHEGEGQPQGLSHQYREDSEGSGILVRLWWWNEISALILWEGADPVERNSNQRLLSISQKREKNCKVLNKEKKVFICLFVCLEVF